VSLFYTFNILEDAVTVYQTGLDILTRAGVCETHSTFIKCSHITSRNLRGPSTCQPCKYDLESFLPRNDHISAYTVHESWRASLLLESDRQMQPIAAYPTSNNPVMNTLHAWRRFH